MTELTHHIALGISQINSSHTEVICHLMLIYNSSSFAIFPFDCALTFAAELPLYFALNLAVVMCDRDQKQYACLKNLYHP